LNNIEHKVITPYRDLRIKNEKTRLKARVISLVS